VTVTIARLRIADGQADFGGGIANTGAGDTLNVVDSTLVDNRATGGLVNFFGSDVVIAAGGGIFNDAGATLYLPVRVRIDCKTRIKFSHYETGCQSGSFS
jgi:hypothetical protein